MSDIRFNTWLHQSGTGGITQVDGGHVGIGTTNPDIAVHTANAKKVNVGIVTANSVYAGNYYGNGSNLTGIGDADKIVEGDTKVEVVDAGSAYIVGEINGSEKVRITSNGNILVGKTDDAGKGVEIYASNNAALRIQNSHTGVGAGDGLLIETSFSDALIWNYENSNTRFATNNIERLRIDSLGNVSIGGINPVPTSTSYYSASLHIHQQSNNSTSGAQVHLTTANKGSAAGDGAQISQYNGNLYINNQDDGNMYFLNNSNSNIRATITSGGNIGINETSPQQLLHVHNDTNYQGILINGNGAPRIAWARSTTTTGEWSAGIDGTNGTQFVINNSNDNSNRKLIISSAATTASGALVAGGSCTAYGNFVVGTAGNGIDFSATSDASGKTSELLDDYEEGSFTPQFDGLSNTPVYAVRNGRYTKIGRYVHITGIIQTWGTNPQFTTTSNILKITGLPYAGSGVIYYVSLGNVSHQHWNWSGSGNNEMGYSAGDIDFFNCQMEHNTSNMIFMLGKGGNTRSRVRNASMHNSGAIIIFELSYTTA